MNTRGTPQRSALLLATIGGSLLLCPPSLLAAKADAGSDFLDQTPSLFDLTPDESAPPPKPLPKEDAPPYDARLHALRILDRSPRIREDAFPDLPSGTRIHELGRVEKDSKDEDLQIAIERVSFETLLREARAKEERGEKGEKLAMLRDALEQYSSEEILFRLHEQIAFLLYDFAIEESRPELFEESASHMEKAIELKPAAINMLSGLAGLYLYMNEVERALETLGRIDPNLIPSENRPAHFALNFNYACAYAMKGEVEKGMLHLELAAQADAPGTLSSIGDPQLDGLRADERYEMLVSQLRKYVMRESPQDNDANP